MKTIKNGNVEIEIGAAEAVQIYDQYGTVCHIRQKITSRYPSVQMSNSRSTGLFKTSEDDMQEYETLRHTLVKVPEGATKEDVQAELNKYEGVIQRVRSYNIQDVLTDGDQWALENKDETGIDLDVLCDKHETQDSEGNRYSGNELRVNSDGEIVNDDLEMEFSRLFYQNEYKPDIDLRGKEEDVDKSSAQNVDARYENPEVKSKELSS